MAAFDLKSYARRGAETRISELTAELKAIYRAFPDLRSPARGRRGARAVVMNHEEQVSGAAASPARPRRRKLTAAERKAIGERMQKYWAARKADAAKKR